MNIVWTIVVCDPVELMQLGEGNPHAKERLECPSLPIYPQWDAQLGYIVVVQDNYMHKLHVLLKSGRSSAWLLRNLYR
jgi:hypothetical protein